MDKTALLRRLLAPLLLVGVALWFYWPTLRIGYLADDFAWMSLRYNIHSFGELVTELLTPRAQGTVRVLSDRLFFLVGPVFAIGSVQGERVLSLLVLGLGIYRLYDTLLLLRVPVLPAMMLAVWWIMSIPLSAAAAWLSSFNQVLGAWLLVEYFRALHHGGGKRITTLLGCLLLTHEAFATAGVMAALYLYLFRREMLRVGLLQSAIAAGFAVVWFTWIRIVSTGPYAIQFSPLAILQYGRIQFGLDRLLSEPSAWTLVQIGILGAVLVLVLLLIRTRQQAFFAIWFGVALFPFLLLPQNLQNYYGAAASAVLVLFLGSLLAAPWPARLTRTALLCLLAYTGTLAISWSKFQMKWYVAQSANVTRFLNSLHQVGIENPECQIRVTEIDPLLANFTLRHIQPGTLLPSNIELTSPPPAAWGPAS